MKNKAVNLHMEQKRALLMMLFFAVVLIGLGVVAILVSSTECAQLDALLRSRYSYSATTSTSVSQDDYYRFNAGISFSSTAEANRGINAEVLMQSEGSNYTNVIYWNASQLDSNSVAITRGLAKKSGLREGDVVYSKHVVDGLTREYTVKQILPEITSADLSSGTSLHDGIIIMGFDSRYVDNISHTSIAYTNESIEGLATKTTGMPESIIYRSDEITAVGLALLPYIVFIALIAVSCTLVLVVLITKSVKYNYRRLATLGFGKTDLSKAYMGIVYRVSIPAVVASFVLSVVFSLLFVPSSVEMALLIGMMFLELLTLFISSRAMQRRLWR